MKRLLLLITTLLTLAAKAQTSVYHPFPDSSAIWNFYTNGFNCPPFGGGTVDSHYSITITGDTLISSQVYYKLFTPFVQTVITGSCSPYVFSGYDGAIRQDTTMRKVFYVPPADSIEQLLYDFALQVGDTVQGFLESFANPKDTVEAIDSIYVGNGFRKRWLINSCYNIYLVEGIGSLFGLIKPSPGCITDIKGYTLTCFSQNGITLYPSPIANCPLITGLNDPDSENYLINISPNPFSEKLTVSNLQSANNKTEIKLFDIYGRMVLSQPLTSANCKLSTANFSSGIYIISIFTEDKVYTQKVTKTD